MKAITVLILIWGVCYGAKQDLAANHIIDITPEKVESGIDVTPPTNHELAQEEAPVLHLNVTEDNVTCILAQFSAKVLLKPSENATKELIINGTLNPVRSQCGHDKQVLAIGFDHGDDLMFTFKRNESIILSEVSLGLKEVKFISDGSKTLFQVAANNSFKCDSGLDIDLKSLDASNRTATLVLRKVRFNAFRTQLNGHFDTDSVCPADIKSNKTVPMIIAFVLAGMIVIILVGYIILRRREDRSAYQSV